RAPGPAPPPRQSRGGRAAPPPPTRGPPPGGGGGRRPPAVPDGRKHREQPGGVDVSVRAVDRRGRLAHRSPGLEPGVTGPAPVFVDRHHASLYRISSTIVRPDRPAGPGSRLDIIRLDLSPKPPRCRNAA